MIKLNLVSKLPGGVPIPALEQALSKASGHSGIINVKLVSEEEIRSLNQRYAGINQTTDVLSFGYQISDNGYQLAAEDREQAVELGDVAISTETAGRQAQAAGTDLATELVTLLVHGALHILGFDHQTKTQQEKLDKLQRDILKQAGLQYIPYNQREADSKENGPEK